MFRILFILGLFGNGVVTVFSPFEFYNQLNAKSNILLLDVRVQEDYNARHIEHAQWAGSAVVMDSIISSYNKDSLVLIYCDYGQRTKTVIKLLKKSGFKQIGALEGGLNLWMEQGFPLTGN